ncbi:hypothetical protein [Candidatus Wolbachia massiliensis]|uniref:Uncharacterized protein n=1 Tax=Candidatus Wolbachia massiliensis TaxID=1845000 RepID=A0A7M3U2F0_9RICK|nr:hypothetical protein [Candidatus Wolbachia massiliensis]QOD38585.1 hypothetical protein ID128_01740 [Candidatus Wolbachia massiliensis]
MKSVKLNFLLMFFLIFGLTYQGYADCPPTVESTTELEAGSKKGWEGFLKIFSFGTAGSFAVDEKLYQYITAKQVKDQGINGYFNPKIQVCDYEGNNCHELYDKMSCQKIYGTQSTGGGVSAAAFIDWEGDKTKVGGEIAQGLEWEWADNVTDEEKKKFAKSPKICACSQKGACMDAFSGGFARIISGANIFRPGDMDNVCDTCSSWSKGKQKVKCAPVPLAPGPPPLCDQLAMSPPQVKIVPITNEDNDYFDPKVKVIAGDLIEENGKIGKELDFPRKYKKDKAGERTTTNGVKEHSILDRDGTTHYFETYREKDKLCAEYRGTEREKSKRKLQFPARCFPSPPAPELEEVSIPKPEERKGKNTLKVKIKTSASTCIKIGGDPSGNLCTFYVNTNSPANIGPLSLKVIKPKIVEKKTKSNDDESNIIDVIEGILRKNPQFKILEQYGCVPNVGIELPSGEEYSVTSPKKNNENVLIKLELDNMGMPKIVVRYMIVKDQANSKSKMLCLFGWKPEPEEFILKRGNEIIPLKSVGTRYVKYDSVYSKESNQFYYLPSKDNEKVDLLQKSQEELDEIIFNKQGYVFFPDKNKQEKGKCSYCVDESKDEKIDDYFDSGKVKVVYKLTDVEYREKCDQGNSCRSTQYLNKKNDKPFYLEYEEVDCKNKEGKILRNEKNEVQKCTQLKDQPIKANRTEVFYADKLCMFDLKSVKDKVLDTIEKRLKSKNLQQPYEFSGDNNYTDDLSKYGYIEIEAWGGGEAGHIDGEAQSTESRPGMPGDYIKVQLKIDPNYPIIKAKATEGGGRLTGHISNKDGGPIFVEMCKLQRQNCKPLITVAGGGIHKKYGNREYKETKVHDDDVKNLKILGNPTIVTGTASVQDNQITYIENGEIKHEAVRCNSVRSNKHGAGGCIDKSSKTYGRGSPGYVIIKSVKIDDKEVEKIIGDLIDLVKDPNSKGALIEELYPGITKEIKEEVKKELLG